MGSKKCNIETRPSKISPREFIEVVNGCLKDYYGDPRSHFGSFYNPSTCTEKIRTQEDIEEYTRSRSFTSVFEDHASGNCWHQALHCLSSCVTCLLPPSNIIQKILDVMLVIDDSSFVIEAQHYLHQLITNYPPSSEAFGQFYCSILKEEEVEQKRVSSPKDPCGSFINVLHQFDAELGKLDRMNKKSSNAAVVISYDEKETESKKPTQSDDEEDDELTLNEDSNLLELCDMNVLTGANMKCWWTNASSEQRIHRLLFVFSIMMEIFEMNLIKWIKRSKAAQKHPFSRPIISRLIWPYEDHGDPSIMLIKMIITMYSVAHRNDLFACMTEFERLISFIAVILPASPLDKGEGYPPDSHQRRVFAQYIANELEDCGLSDDRLEIAVARLKPSWLRSIVGSKIHNQRSNRSCGDLPLNVAQLTQMIIQSLAWGDAAECDSDSSEDNEDEPSTSTKKNKKRAIKRNAKGETQLHVLCRTGKSDKLLEALSKQGQNINIADYAGWTALHEAVTHGNLDCVKLLLEYQPPKKVYQTRQSLRESDKSEDDPTQGTKPIKTVVNLHAKGGDMGLTPLHEAVIQNRYHVADLLLEHGGSKLLKDTTNSGLTPLDLAVNERMSEVLQSHKKESRLVEKQWISDMTSNAMHMVSTPSDSSCIILRCMLLQAYLESNCLMQIMFQLSKFQAKKQRKNSKSSVVQNIDYLEYSHDMKALQSFIKCAKAHMNGKVTFPEACLLAFLC